MLHDDLVNRGRTCSAFVNLMWFLCSCSVQPLLPPVLRLELYSQLKSERVTYWLHNTRRMTDGKYTLIQNSSSDVRSHLFAHLVNSCFYHLFSFFQSLVVIVVVILIFLFVVMLIFLCLASVPLLHFGPEEEYVGRRAGKVDRRRQDEDNLPRLGRVSVARNGLDDGVRDEAGGTLGKGAAEAEQRATKVGREVDVRDEVSGRYPAAERDEARAFNLFLYFDGKPNVICLLKKTPPYSD
jgi:hypothetical protein